MPNLKVYSRRNALVTLRSAAVTVGTWLNLIIRPKLHYMITNRIQTSHHRRLLRSWTIAPSVDDAITNIYSLDSNSSDRGRAFEIANSDRVDGYINNNNIRRVNIFKKSSNNKVYYDCGLLIFISPFEHHHRPITETTTTLWSVSISISRSV